MSSVSSMSVTGKKMCSNSLFIRGANGELAGLLCINFDSSRYEELAGRSWTSAAASSCPARRAARA